MQATDPVTITLTAAQWNTIIEVLHSAPYRVAAPIIGDITSQAQPPPEVVAEAVAADRETKPGAVRVRKSRAKTNGAAPAPAPTPAEAEGATNDG